MVLEHFQYIRKGVVPEKMVIRIPMEDENLKLLRKAKDFEGEIIIVKNAGAGTHQYLGEEKRKKPIKKLVFEGRLVSRQEFVKQRAVEVEVNAEEIDTQGFRGAQIGKIVLKEGLKTIRDFAFSRIENHEREILTLPQSLERLEEGAFYETRLRGLSIGSPILEVRALENVKAGYILFRKPPDEDQRKVVLKRDTITVTEEVNELFFNNPNLSFKKGACDIMFREQPLEIQISRYENIEEHSFRALGLTRDLIQFVDRKGDTLNKDYFCEWV